MSALIPGYEYDIFISYRQNDNRSGWVTEFVKALQEELASTIKDPVSVYFDSNPHDGLLETHNVDKSLEGKLKCLVFIPILSQTYCDTKSFAWQQEFCAFNTMAKGDLLGRDIRLGNGNVTSRILPVRIHELDEEDKSSIESELGSVVRPIDFIFKSAGVNRPLEAHELHPHDNLNKTYYKDQVNKVANAVKELVSGMRGHRTKPGATAVTQPSTKTKRSLLVGFGAVFLMLVAGYFLYPQIMAGLATSPDKSIAVLPFADMSKEEDMEYMGDGIAEEIINVLAKSPELKVIARSSSFHFKGRNEDLREIGRRLGVAVILEGSVRKFKDQLRVTAQMINVEDGFQYWSRSIDSKAENLFEVQDAIAIEVATALQITFAETVTSNPKHLWDDAARRLYLEGRFYYDRLGRDDVSKSSELLAKSVALDSNQAISQVYYGNSFVNGWAGFENTPSTAKVQALFQRWLKHVDRSLELDPKLAEAHAMKALYCFTQQCFKGSVQEINLAMQTGFNSPMVLRTAGRMLAVFGAADMSILYSRKAYELDPLQVRSLLFLSEALFYNRDYDEAMANLEHAMRMSPSDNVRALMIRALIEKGRAGDGRVFVQDVSDEPTRQFLDLLISLSSSEANRRNIDLEDLSLNNYQLAVLYLKQGNKKRSVECLRRCIEVKEPGLAYVNVDPVFDDLRMDAGFKHLLKKMGFPNATEIEAILQKE